MITSTGDNVDLVGSKNPFDDGTGHADTKWHHLAVTVAPDADDATKNDVDDVRRRRRDRERHDAAYVSAFSSTTTGAPMTHAGSASRGSTIRTSTARIDDVRVSCRAFTATRSRTSRQRSSECARSWPRLPIVTSACSVISGDLLHGDSDPARTRRVGSDAGSGPGSGMPVTDGLVLDYEFDDCAGAVATDATAAHHDGTSPGRRRSGAAAAAATAATSTMTPGQPRDRVTSRCPPASSRTSATSRSPRG